MLLAFRSLLFGVAKANSDFWRKRVHFNSSVQKTTFWVDARVYNNLKALSDYEAKDVGDLSIAVSG